MSNDRSSRDVGLAKTLAIASFAVAIIGCVAACLHANETWQGENYERIAVTFAIVAIGVISAAILGIAAFIKSRGDTRSRRLAALSIVAALISPGGFLLWLFLFK